MSVSSKWKNDTLPNHPVPFQLHQWQEDSISYLFLGESVAMCCPTGSGKTLPQLAASLFFSDGVALVIPPLISIESQLEDICNSWKQG